MKTYNYYLKLQEAVQKNPNADLVKALNQQANVTNCTMWGCWAMSCMCCACCSKPAQSCVQNADMGTQWKQALLAYKDMTPQQTRTVYLKGMQLMNSIHTHLTQHISQQKNTLNTYVAQGNVTDYTLQSLSHTILQQDIQSGEWMYELMNKIKTSLFSQTMPDTMEYQGLQLTQAHIRLLLACCGFFYPSLCQRFVTSVNQAEMTMIRRCALENC